MYVSTSENDFLSSELTVAEMKTLWEAEKQRIIQDMKVAHAKEIEKSISETKKKQWVSIETIHNIKQVSIIAGHYVLCRQHVIQ